MKCGSAEVALTYLNRAVDLEVLRFCLLFEIFFNSKVLIRLKTRSHLWSEVSVSTNLTDQMKHWRMLRRH